MEVDDVEELKAKAIVILLQGFEIVRVCVNLMLSDDI